MSNSQARQRLDVEAFYEGSYENPSRLFFSFVEQEFVSCCVGVRFGGGVAVPIPEPATYTLMGLPVLSLLAYLSYRRRHQKAAQQGHPGQSTFLQLPRVSR